MALVGKYLLDGDGTDASGNGNHGTLFGSPSFVSGLSPGSSQALRIASNSQYLRLPNLFNLANPSAGFAAVVQYSEDPGSDPIVLVENIAGLLGIRGDRLSAYVEGSYLTAGAGTLPVGEIHRVGWDYDGTTYRLFVDGVEVASDTRTLSSSTNQFRIGAHSSNLHYVDGAIDNLFLYDASVGVQGVRDDWASWAGRLGKTHPAITTVDSLITAGTRVTLTPWAMKTSDSLIADQQSVAHGKLANGASLLSGTNKKLPSVPSVRADFDGVDDVATCGTAGSLGSSLSNGALVAAAFAVDDVSSGNQTVFGVQWEGGVTPTGVFLQVESDGTVTFEISKNGGSTFSADSSIKVGDGDHRVVLFAKDDNTAAMVIDGVVDDSVTTSGTYPSGIPDMTEDFTIGAYNLNGSSFQDYLDGKVDYLEIAGSSDVSSLTTVDLHAIDAAMAGEKGGWRSRDHRSRRVLR
jgi:hypothetical protein